MNQGRGDKVFERLAQATKAGATVRVERLFSGELLFERAAGQLRQGGRAMLVGDRFHLASIAKTMTAAVVLQLAEEGSFGRHGIDATLASTGVFSDPVMARLLVVDGRAQGDLLTLRHLLQHTGGLRDAMVDDRHTLGGPASDSLIGGLMGGRISPMHHWVPWDAKLIDVPEAGVLNYYLNEVAHAGLSVPGTAFHYSDTGYILLGLLIEAVGGQPLHQAFRRRIFDPMGLDQTYLAYRGDPPELGADRFPESEPWMGPMPCFSSGGNLSFDWAGGGVVTTAKELAAFLRGLLRGQLFATAASLEEMNKFVRPKGLLAPRVGVGLGLFNTVHEGISLVGHSGAWGCKMFATPEYDLLISGTLNNADVPEDWHVQLLKAFITASSS